MWPGVLELAQLAQHDRVAEVEVGTAMGSIPNFTRSGRPSASFSRGRPPGSISAAPLPSMRSRSRRPCRRGCYQRCYGPGVTSVTLRADASGAHRPALVCSRCRRRCSLPSLSDDQSHATRSPRPRSSTRRRLADRHAAREREPRRALPRTDRRDMRDAVVAIEDRRFFEHHGVDLRAILRAALHRRDRRGTRRGWFDHHPAAGEEPLHRRRRRRFQPQARGGGPRLADGEPATRRTQILDELPEHRLLRRGRLRRRGRRARPTSGSTPPTSRSRSRRCSPG